MTFLSNLALRFSAPEKQFSEAIRLWNAGDDTGAIAWGRLAARRLDLAKVALAQWLTHGDRGTAAVQESLKLLTEGAESGFSEAQQVLAASYLNGTFGDKNPEARLYWTKRAADGGNVACQIAMVRFLTLGEYREPDVELAMHYAELAAESGRSEILAALVQDLAAKKAAAAVNRGVAG